MITMDFMAVTDLHLTLTASPPKNCGPHCAIIVYASESHWKKNVLCCAVPAKPRQPTHPGSINTRVPLTKWITLDSSFGRSWVRSFFLSVNMTARIVLTVNALKSGINLNNSHYFIWLISFISDSYYSNGRVGTPLSGYELPDNRAERIQVI